MSSTAVLSRPQTFRRFEPPRRQDIMPHFFVARADMPQEILAAEADTQGWDTASAVRLSQVNRALEKTAVSPVGFKQDVTADWKIEGKFNAWRMTRGGSGSIVFLRTPIPSASMIFSGAKTDLENAVVTIQVKLNYLPQQQDNARDPRLGDRNLLETDVAARSPEDPAVVVQHIDYGTKPVDELFKALFQSAIAKWYNANLSTFSYVFNIVTLNQLAESPQFQWLKPTYTSYAYYDGLRDDPSEDVAYFGALTMNGRNPDGLANQLPASAIPDGQGAALLIGMRLYMENMVLPGVQAAFPGSCTSDYKISNGNTSVQLARDLAMAKVKVGLIWYEPTAEEFTLQIIGDEIQVRSKVHVPISPGLNSYIVTESYYRIKLVTKPDGTQTIDWVESRPTKKEHYETKEDWVVITEFLVGVIGAVFAIIAGAVLQGVLRVVVVIIILVVAGIAAATPELIAKAISKGAANALPSINEMLTELLTPVEWPDTAGFVLTRAELNGSLQLSGSFTNAG